MPEAVVIFEERIATNNKKIGIATLNAPKSLNALTTEMVELMLEKFAQWQTDTRIACVVINGSGEKAFCAGGDVQALHASATAVAGGPCIEAEHFFAREYRLDHMIHTFNKPVIAWGDGIVMGGGLGVFAGASHRVVTETSRFAMPEVTIGLYPDAGGSFFLNTMPGKSGQFLALTGASFNASDAIYTSIANTFIAREYEDALLIALLNTAPDSHTAVDETLAEFTANSVDSRPVDNIEPHLDAINTLCGSESIHDIVAAFAALETDDKWLSKAKKGIAHGSPLSIVLIDEQLKRSEKLSLEATFRNELILSTNIIRFPEFAEGVRALLIDKDRNPQWQFKNIESIPNDIIESFFQAPWKNNPLEDL